MRLLLAVAIASAGCVSAAFAAPGDPVKPVVRPRPTPPVASPNIQAPTAQQGAARLVAPKIGGGVSTLVTAKQTSATNRVLVATNAPLGGAALSTFSLGFLNGDHKIREIAVLQSEGRASATFADQDSNDSFGFSARWYAAGYPLATVSAVGEGEFDIALPRPPDGYVPLLAGFSLTRQNRTDANVRAIGVRLTPDLKFVRVTLLDDQGLDVRDYEALAGAGFALSLAPVGGIESAVATGAAITGLAAAREFGKKGLRRFAATVQIAWAPHESIRRRGSASGSLPTKIDSGSLPAIGTCRSTAPGTNCPKTVSPWSSRPASNSPSCPQQLEERIKLRQELDPANCATDEKSALTGFLFHFQRDDHHLMRLASGIGSYSTVAVEFRDSNGDDPIQWLVDYAVVK
ncbi:MAG: hypothetical protein R3E77_05315 [Steroidobacteraceae bacterium]